MALVENNDMIEQIVPDRAHESFRRLFRCRNKRRAPGMGAEQEVRVLMGP